MASFNNLRMAKTVGNNSCISISKSFLGLRTKVTYLPTNSPVEVRTLEFTPEAGDRLKAILSGPAESFSRAIASFNVQPTVNGNYLLEACISRDGAFAALQLLRFQQLNYEPVTDVLFYEANDAQAVRQCLMGE